MIKPSSCLYGFKEGGNMRLEVGKTYLTVSGRKCKIIYASDIRATPFLGILEAKTDGERLYPDDIVWYNPNGTHNEKVAGLSIEKEIGGNMKEKDILTKLFDAVAEQALNNTPFDMSNEDFYKRTYHFGKANGRIEAFLEVMKFINKLREEQGD